MSEGGLMTQNRRAAAERVYRENYAALVRLALVLVGDRPSAEDVVHDVFVGLQARWPMLRHPA